MLQALRELKQCVRQGAMVEEGYNQTYSEEDC